MMNIGPFQLDTMDIGPFQWDGAGGGGSGSPDEVDDGFGLSLDSLFVSTDYSPQVIGRFDVNPTGVTIEVWDVISGVNAPVSVTDDECYPIGDTGRWGWSTSNLTGLNGVINQYVYRMTGDTLEEFIGTFIVKNHKKVSGKIPRDDSHIRRL